MRCSVVIHVEDPNEDREIKLESENEFEFTEDDQDVTEAMQEVISDMEESGYSIEKNIDDEECVFTFVDPIFSEDELDVTQDARMFLERIDEAIEDTIN